MQRPVDTRRMRVVARREVVPVRNNLPGRRVSTRGIEGRGVRIEAHPPIQALPWIGPVSLGGVIVAVLSGPIHAILVAVIAVTLRIARVPLHARVMPASRVRPIPAALVVLHQFGAGVPGAVRIGQREQRPTHQQQAADRQCADSAGDENDENKIAIAVTIVSSRKISSVDAQTDAINSLPPT